MRLDELREQPDGRQERHQLLEGVHLHPEIALELGVPGSCRRRHAKTLAGSAHRNAEDVELNDCQDHDDQYPGHALPLFAVRN